MNWSAEENQLHNTWMNDIDCLRAEQNRREESRTEKKRVEQRLSIDRHNSSDYIKKESIKESFQNYFNSLYNKIFLQFNKSVA